MIKMNIFTIICTIICIIINLCKGEWATAIAWFCALGGCVNNLISEYQIEDLQNHIDTLRREKTKKD